MTEIIRRPIHPSEVPGTRDGLPIAPWIFVFRGRGGGYVLGQTIVDGVVKVEQGFRCRRLLAASSGQVEFAVARHPETGTVYVLGDESSVPEALALLDPGVAEAAAAEAAAAEAAAAEAAAAEAAAAEAAAAEAAAAAAEAGQQDPTEPPAAFDATARSKAEALGLEAADIAKATKAELAELAGLVGVALAEGKVADQRAQLAAALGFAA